MMLTEVRLETFQHLLRTRRSQRAVKDYLPQVTSGIKDEGIPPSTELSTPMVTEMSPIRTKILDFGVGMLICLTTKPCQLAS